MPTVSVVGLSILVLGLIILTVILLVVCGKRKLIQRKECSRRDPHIPGQEAKKAMKKEIDRRIDRVAEIYYEPRLLSVEVSNGNTRNFPSYYFRMKAVDNMKYLEDEISSISGVQPRTSRDTIRAFFVNLSFPGGVLAFVEPRVIHELCDFYDHARHHPSYFGAEQFTIFHALLVKILHSARSGLKRIRKNVSSGGKAPSDNDSAIDEPEQDQSGDDENLLVTESNMVLLQRPKSLKVTTDDDFETSV